MGREGDAVTATLTARPILFSGPMVQAILEGRKTQTRRVLKLQPLDVLTKRPPWANNATRVFNGRRCWFYLAETNPNRGGIFKCRHGEVGDQLWVRETWATSILDPEGSSFQDDPDNYTIVYRADKDDAKWKEHWTHCEVVNGRCKQTPCAPPWRPSIHMPRWASRLTLEITDVRVERIRQITSADCIREGFSPTMRNETPAKERFKELWDTLNAKRGHSWESNTWVWVLSFKVIEQGG